MRTAIAAPAITVAGCAPEQREVARLMARLHDIDGVTRVSLSKSTAETIDADDNGATERQQRNATPCGTGKRPSFEMVMFFEQDAAAVATTPTTSSGSVSATPTPTPTATPAAGAEGTTTTTTTTTDSQRRGDPVSRYARIAIAVVASAGAVYGYWKVDVAPKRAEAAKLEQEVATQEAQLAQTQA